MSLLAYLHTYKYIQDLPQSIKNELPSYYFSQDLHSLEQVCSYPNYIHDDLSMTCPCTYVCVSKPSILSWEAFESLFFSV